MIYTIKNDRLTVKISDYAAEIRSVTGNGCEYIWQPEEGHWQRQAPWLFPICGGLTEGRYVYRGKTYEMQKHGFARTSLFTLDGATDAAVTMTLTDSAETLAVYPFAFRLTVTYALSDDRLLCTVRIANPGTDELIAGIGAHPGFRVPLSGDGRFEDWTLVFANECSPGEMTLSDDHLWSGESRPFPLEGSKSLPLTRDLFSLDARFLFGAGDTVTLRSDRSPHSVTVRYAGFPYVGFWSEPTDVGFLCIEPWQGLPAVSGVIDDLETKRDLFHIAPGKERTVALEMQFQ